MIKVRPGILLNLIFFSSFTSKLPMKSLIPSIVISLAVLIGTYWISNAYQNRGKVHDSISVTGLGEHNFTSDLIVWRAGFSVKQMDLKQAYTELKKDRERIERYFLEKGVERRDMVFQAIDISKNIRYDYDNYGNLQNSYFEGYTLSQQLKIESKNVDLVENLSRESTELIDLGIELNSYPPEYYYTKLNELKIKMIESATKDARHRADRIAQEAGSSLGELKSADLGVFQITGQHSSEEYSWGGSFNTHDKAKTARVTMRLRYNVD